MMITAITVQAKNNNRVNVSVDGKYRFSLELSQVVELGIKVGNDYSADEIKALEDESEYGKLYMRTLEYCFVRLRSAKEIRDYLWRKTRTRMVKKRVYTKAAGQTPTIDMKLVEQPGVSQSIADRVYQRLEQKGYIDDEKFARSWLENRSLSKGASQRKLSAELRAKGVAASIIDELQKDSPRRDEEELVKIYQKKQHRYSDPVKLKQYLLRQGFSYELVNQFVRARDQDAVDSGMD